MLASGPCQGDADDATGDRAPCIMRRDVCAGDEATNRCTKNTTRAPVADEPEVEQGDAQQQADGKPSYYLLISAAAAAQTASSCDPVPPEQPIAPMILPSSMSGMPPVRRSRRLRSTRI